MKEYVRDRVTDDEAEDMEKAYKEQIELMEDDIKPHFYNR